MKSLALNLIEENRIPFDNELVEAAKLVLLDTLGAIITGMQQEETFALAKRSSNRGDYAIVGTNFKTDLYSAGLVHGTAAVATEMDEGNQYSKGHPAAHVVPVLLTKLQNREAVSGRHFIDLLIKSYEACSRFGRATTLRPEAHAHGTWGVMGAAATALLIEDATVEEFCEGVNISATFALPTLWTAALEGKSLRNIYAGHAIEMGMRTTDFLQTNHLAPKNNAEYVFASVLGTDFNLADLERSKTDQWDIASNYFKTYAFCRYAHSPIDAFKEIVEKNELRAEEIKQVTVYTYARAATLNRVDSDNVLSSKFSIPFALAAYIHTKKSDQSLFIEHRYKDEEIQRFAKKVTVQVSTELEKDYPKIMPSLVEVEDINGNVYKEQIDIAVGGPGKRLTKEEITQKFTHLTLNVLDKSTQNELVNFIMNIEEKDDIRPLFEMCTAVKKEHGEWSTI